MGKNQKEYKTKSKTFFDEHSLNENNFMLSNFSLKNHQMSVVHFNSKGSAKLTRNYLPNKDIYEEMQFQKEKIVTPSLFIEGLDSNFDTAYTELLKRTNGVVPDIVEAGYRLMSAGNFKNLIDECNFAIAGKDLEKLVQLGFTKSDLLSLEFEKDKVLEYFSEPKVLGRVYK